MMRMLKESQLTRERVVADARLATITAQLARFQHQHHQSQESQFSPEGVFVNIVTGRLQSALRRRDAKLRRKLRNQEEVSTKILS